jgi:hypothetical protein
MGEAEEEEDMEVAGRCQMIKAWTEEVNESSNIHNHQHYHLNYYFNQPMVNGKPAFNLTKENFETRCSFIHFP